MSEDLYQRLFLEIHQLNGKVSNLDVSVSGLDTKVDLLQQDVGLLKKEVMGGEGHDSILTRLKLIETLAANSKGFNRWLVPVSISFLSLAVACAALILN